MAYPLVLDSAGLSGLIDAKPSSRLRALMSIAHQRRRQVVVPSIVCAEVARGRSRTRALESLITRHGPNQKGRSPLLLIDTDFDLARQIGAILYSSGADSTDIVDAHLIATCLPFGGGLIATSDPDDLLRLAEAVPAIRINVTQV